MLADVLKTVLERYPKPAQPAAEPESLGNAGGLSGASLWRFPSELGLLVARAWPSSGASLIGVRRIHRWLESARTLDFVASPLPDRQGRTAHELAGRVWDVSPWMPGRPPCVEPANADEIRAGFAGLAALHRALGTESIRGASSGLAARLREIEKLLSGEFAALEQAVDRAGRDPRREFAERWFVPARALAPKVQERLGRALKQTARLQPCLRDARPEHFLFERGCLTGLVDFGAMGVDSISCDLARLIGEWIGRNPVARADALAAYHAVSALDETDASLIEIFEESAALLSAGHWIRWHFVERRVFEDPNAVAVGITRSLDRLARFAH
jgi:homoserine kinase type II